ncbi:bifunctional diaminohydroxyphosphoribosylaminopyrimidine deaminase/5-amino-6-(5-phosphoribosylamino)uracil reductase RibD [Sinimarinibacterium sp. NLF-5-8]|uniref:bifunctional diaminohydroxyphosphoribosylaminopyrimidine deaminase/5-amino-6-(5-phosphoribosylamino)uracil reductase RibD n=1 Tax=Sinimarinibacterium sp. NLF-5-8 TaxID=2698684 RepID=UPI00137C2B5B|nr:bifunctional diaminohydroxyphosphoribosylaminopyrimidine deaminase/5-amino-6-(5-phosphoribosylamino)uracil reductase RibD [Sinimarinibacterium sp. NLF-5-8]
MQRALALAARGQMTTQPNPRVGCVIVDDHGVAGEGWHARAGEPHAEVHALRAAGARARGATVLVTLEPCAHFGRTPPCAQALIDAGVAEVWVATLDPNPQVAGKGIALLDAAGITTHIGLLRAQADALNRGFMLRMRHGRPWITLKLAASLDARTAMASGESQWITGSAARADVHRLRAEAGAVLTGIGTLLADDPQLTVRGIEAARRQPDRIVVDTRARAPLTARVWQHGARRFWCSARAPETLPDGVLWLDCAQTAQGLDLADVVRQLGVQQINEVLVEAGGVLAGSFLRARLVDELVLYSAPCVLGDDARPLLQVPGLERLADRIAFKWTDATLLGEDLRLRARPLDPDQ